MYLSAEKQNACAEHNPDERLCVYNKAEIKMLGGTRKNPGNCQLNYLDFDE